MSWNYFFKHKFQIGIECCEKCLYDHFRGVFCKKVSLYTEYQFEFLLPGLDLVHSCYFGWSKGGSSKPHILEGVAVHSWWFLLGASDMIPSQVSKGSILTLCISFCRDLQWFCSVYTFCLCSRNVWSHPEGCLLFLQLT